jgi:hypothetical protein
LAILSFCQKLFFEILKPPLLDAPPDVPHQGEIEINIMDRPEP